MPVYFIAENENENKDYDMLRIKIGISKNISKRLSQLQTGSPYKLILMGWIESDDDKMLERELHKKYSSYNTHLEWFSLSSSHILAEFKNHSTSSYIAVNENAFEIIDHDRDGTPIFLGSWQWTDVEYSEFCPICGWGGGLDYNENYRGIRCLKCGIINELCK